VSDGIPFIPLWLDQADLSPAQFRVLSTLWRRAGRKGQCWPTRDTLWKDCKIHRDTLGDVLNELEANGWISRSKLPGNRNLYTLIVGGKEGPTTDNELAESEGQQSTESEGMQIAESKGQQLAESEGHKNTKGKNTKKIPQETTYQTGLSSDSFVQSLRERPEYGHINIDHEVAKMKSWIKDHPGRRFTQKFAINWLNRIQAPAPPKAVSLGGRAPAQDTFIDFSP